MTLVPSGHPPGTPDLLPEAIVSRKHAPVCDPGCDDSGTGRSGDSGGPPTYTETRAASPRRLERRCRRAGGGRRRRARRAARPAALHDPAPRQPADDRGRADAGLRGSGRRRRARRARRGRARDRAGNGRRGHRGDRPGARRPRDLRGRRLAAPRQEDRAEDRQPEALRRRDPRAHGHVRDRPGRDGQDLSRHGPRGQGALGAGGRAHHPDQARGRGRANGSASCPATCSPRSILTCGRCSTRSTTCSTPTG